MPNFKEFIKGFEEKPEAQQPEKDELFDKYKALGHDNTTAKLLANDERERNNPENKRLEKVAQQRVEQGIDAKPLDPQHIKSTGYLGFGSPEKLEEASKPQPKRSPYKEWRSNPENAKREKEADAKYKPMYEELDKKDDELYKAYYYEQDPKKKAELKAQMDENDKKINALLDEWGKATGYPETPEEKRAWASLENMSQPKQGSFEQAFGNNQPREEFSQEDKAALVATYGAFPEEGIVARKLPNGNYLTNILSGADTEPEEVDEATLSKVFDELRGEKGFEEIINEWRENPNLIRERRNVQ